LTSENHQVCWVAAGRLRRVSNCEQSHHGCRPYHYSIVVWEPDIRAPMPKFTNDTTVAGASVLSLVFQPEAERKRAVQVFI